MTHGQALATPVPDALAAEARALHRAIFGTAAPPAVVDAYVRAHEYYCTPNAPGVNVAAAVRDGADIEALELALRTRDPALSRKCRILVYIAEATPGGYAQLVNTRSRRFAAWRALAVAVLRTAVLRAKGALAARRVPYA